MSTLSPVSLMILIILVILVSICVNACVNARVNACVNANANAIGGGAAAPAIDWPATTCIEPASVTAAYKYIRRVPGYGPIPYHELEQKAAELNRQNAAAWTADGLASLRRMSVPARAHAAAHRFRTRPDLRTKAVAAWRSGKTITEVAAEYDILPMAALHAVADEAMIKSWARDATTCKAAADGVASTTASKTITMVRRVASGAASSGASSGASKEELARLKMEAPDAFEADYGSRIHNMRTQAAASRYEGVVGKFLRSALDRAGLQHVAVKTEADIRATGDTLLTPDFLFSEPVAIRVADLHGHASLHSYARVNWLDAKNYLAVDDPLTFASLKKQAAKYTAAFGPGAFVFNQVMCGSKTAQFAPLLTLSH